MNLKKLEKFKEELLDLKVSEMVNPEVTTILDEIRTLLADYFKIYSSYQRGKAHSIRMKLNWEDKKK